MQLRGTLTAPEYKLGYGTMTDYFVSHVYILTFGWVSNIEWASNCTADTAHKSFYKIL